MSAHGGNGKSGDDGFITIAIFIGLGIMMAVALWATMKMPIVLFVYAIDAIQYIPFYVLGLLDSYSKSEFLHVLHTLSWVLNPSAPEHSGVINPNEVTFQNMMLVQADIGGKTWFIYAGIIAYMWHVVKSKMKGDGVRRIWSISGKRGMSFQAYQARVWTDGMFGVGFNPQDRPITAEAPIRPMDWVKLYDVSVTRDTSGEKARPKLDEPAVETLFAKQIGRKWKGFRKEPFYTRAFLVLCMMSLQAKQKEVDNYRNAINKAFYSGKDKNIIKAEVEALMEAEIKKDNQLVDEIDKVASAHYYSNTACLGVIGYCGPFVNWNGGQGIIICPSMYMWMTNYDRTLFLALHSHGRYGIKSHIEAAGVISHYQLERVTQSPQAAKYATSAVEALKEHLESIRVVDMASFNRAHSMGQRRYKVKDKMEEKRKVLMARRQAALKDMDPAYL